jgi:two-component system LytT family response regulator
MKNMRCLIADDEKEAREGLFLMLKNYPEVDVVSICPDGLDAIRMIRELKPDVAFLDIQMPKVNGFEVVNSLHGQKPLFVFVSAYDQYAIKAFEVHALDYLLKPFRKERLDETIEHFKKMVSGTAAVVKKSEQLPVWQPPAWQPPGYGDQKVIVDQQAFPGKLILKADGQVYFVDMAAVVRVEAYDYYVKVYTRERYYLVRDSMKNMENKLAGGPFVRVHKSGIVNTGYIQSIEPLGNNDHLITLTDQSKVKASRSYAGALQKWTG